MYCHRNFRFYTHMHLCYMHVTYRDMVMCSSGLGATFVFLLTCVPNLPLLRKIFFSTGKNLCGAVRVIRS